MAVKIVIIAAFLAATIQARPDAALPYYYNSPTIEQNSLGRTGQQSPAFNLPIKSYGTPIFRGSNTVLPNRNYLGPEVPTAAYKSQPEPTVRIQKHIYVHVAPSDADEQRLLPVQQPPIQRQKHYKIIFVKVPAYDTPAPYVAQPQTLQQEKTLIYVLVKKPEEPKVVPVKQVASAPISKPEVYFIKYKAKSEATAGQNVVPQSENVLEPDNESVVVESAARGAAVAQQQGYQYDRPGRGVLLK